MWQVFMLKLLHFYCPWVKVFDKQNMAGHGVCWVLICLSEVSSSTAEHQNLSVPVMLFDRWPLIESIVWCWHLEKANPCRAGHSWSRFRISWLVLWSLWCWKLRRRSPCTWPFLCLQSMEHRSCCVLWCVGNNGGLEMQEGDWKGWYILVYRIQRNVKLS